MSAARPITFGSLFTGIGGLDLGLERAGMVCRWQVENNTYCLRVLAKHWPEVPKHGDIEQLDGTELQPVDLVAGGFPCQDVSNSGLRIGINGSRSGLWGHMHRIVRALRPRLVLVENVTGLTDRGFGRVLGDLAALGFDAEWAVLPACALGAPHTRERVFIVAYADGSERWAGNSTRRGSHRQDDVLAVRTEDPTRTKWLAEAALWWSAEPGVDRVAHGIPSRLDRHAALGNAVVPQVAELIGRQILEAVRGA